MITIAEIGVIRSKFTEPADPFAMKREESQLIVDEQFSEGLLGIDERKYLQVIFHFHKSDSFSLINTWYYRGERGVFACRTPNRPSTIGTTTVELIRREGNVLTVKGLDALDGTPLLDIKPWIEGQDSVVEPNYVDPFQIDTPRHKTIRNLKSGDLKALLTDAGTLHGHYCPGLSFGVLAAYHGLRKLADRTGMSFDAFHRDGGMEELLAIIEINSCFADGIQYVSGATLGNNGLVYKDMGKTAVTFTGRDGKGIRMVLKGNARGIAMRLVPEYKRLFEEVIIGHDRDDEKMRAYRRSGADAGFALLELDAEELFTIQEVEVTLPSYAPIKESMTCRACGEKVMAGDMSSTDETLCRSCAHDEYQMIDGTGFHKERD